MLADVGPATLALARLGLGALVLVPLARVLHPGARLPVSARDRWRIFWSCSATIDVARVGGATLAVVGERS